MGKGVFWGVSVGPGDPELMTLKAARLLGRCRVIAAPVTRSGQMLAWETASKAVDLSGKTVLPLYLTMDPDPEKRKEAHQAAADAVEAWLYRGEDVAMLDLGDVSVWASFSYVAAAVRERGYETAMVPGVPSFCAAAARLGTGLVEGETPLHIVPGKDLDALSLPGTKVLMKTGRRMPELLSGLERRGLLDRSALAVDLGMESERIFPDLSREGPEGDVGYFATVIVKE